jgi:hypothetical protein
MGKGEYLAINLFAHCASSQFVIQVIRLAIHSGSLQHNKMGEWVMEIDYGTTSA